MKTLGKAAARAALGLVLALGLIGSAAADDGSDMPASRPALLLNGLGVSQNWASWSTWAGLPSLPQPGAVSYVKGEWTVPSVACDATDDSSSVWVGIDGLFSSSVEQVGTE